MESEDLYCYEIANSNWQENPACRIEKIDLISLDFAYCAPTFSDFLYRFWIENEIWFALEAEGGPRQLDALQQLYVNRYLK